MLSGATRDDAAPQHAVSIIDLKAQLVLAPEFAAHAENRVDHVRAARTFTELESARAHEIVVLDPVLIPAVSTYRFDLALGALGPDVAAVLGGRPSATAQRTALSKGVVLGGLAPGADFSSLLLLVRDLARGRQQRDLSVLEAMCRACDLTKSAVELDDLLAEASQLLGASVELAAQPSSSNDEVIRLHGAPTMYLLAGDAPLAGSHLSRAARSYLARCLQQLLQAEVDAQPSGVVPTSDLLNEILLDEADSVGAVQRLRRTGFPLDGSHTAIRVDCHGNAEPGEAPMTARLRVQIGEAVSGAVADAAGQWTRTGTQASIVLIASQSGAEIDENPLNVARSANWIVAAIEGLGAQVHIGVGTAHVGVEGLRATVSEATTALRSAVDNRTLNEPHYFDRLGLGRALMQWSEIKWVKPVVNETLAPLLEQPPDRRRESLRTLRTYLDTGRSIGQTARLLHMHRNSVRYRIARIEQMLDVDLNDPDERLFIELGCRLFLDEA